MPFTYEYPRPNLTVDCIIIGSDDQNLSRILLIQRKHEPFEGKWALPGGFVEEQELADEAAKRELVEETGLSGVELSQFYTFSTTHRDPRGWTISIAYYAFVEISQCKIQAGDDASDAKWFPITQLPGMAFDHIQIIDKALAVIESGTEADKIRT